MPGGREPMLCSCSYSSSTGLVIGQIPCGAVPLFCSTPPFGTRERSPPEAQLLQPSHLRAPQERLCSKSGNAASKATCLRASVSKIQVVTPQKARSTIRYMKALVAFVKGGSMAVKRKDKVAVVGIGEIGKPLFELFSQHHEAVGVDITPVERIEQVDYLHICYPFQIQGFVGETVRYIALFRPALTIINSTVAVGTTRTIAEQTRTAVVNSPVRGKHTRMLDEMRMYTKFVGAVDARAGERAARHFESVGLKTKILSSPEATELAKLTETTYFGLMIAWAQEVERYCAQWGEEYDEVVSFYDEIKFFPPVKYFPGIIGGHCVMQNIEILNKRDHSVILAAIKASNQMKLERDREVNGKKEAVDVA